MIYKTQPWPYQATGLEIGLDFLNKYNAWYSAWEMGTGKSWLWINMMARVMEDRNRRNLNILVACPKAVIPVWRMQFEFHAPFEYAMLCLDKQSNNKFRAIKCHEFYENNKGVNRVIVVNYESAWRDYLGAWMLNYGDFDFMLGDEGHKLKAPNSKQSNFFARLGKTQERICGLGSGTPMTAPKDVYGQFRFIDPRVYGTNWYQFRNRYCVMAHSNDQIIVAYKNVDELKFKFDSRAHSLRSKDVIHDLPPVEDNILYSDFSAASKKFYKELRDDFVAEVKGELIEVKNAAVLLTKLQSVTSGFIKSDDKYIHLDDKKLDVLADLIEGIDNEEPIVVFHRFIPDSEKIAKFLSNSGRRTGRVCGGCNDYEAFYKGELDTLVVNAQSGGSGLDLTRAKIGIFYSFGLSVTDFKQCRKRLDRPGQKRPISFYHIVTQDSVDEHILKTYQRRVNDTSLLHESSEDDIVREIANIVKQGGKI